MNTKEIYRCLLDPDLRECPHYSYEKDICIDGIGCGFRDKVEQKSLKKKHKWFEKYYENNRTI